MLKHLFSKLLFFVLVGNCLFAVSCSAQVQSSPLDLTPIPIETPNMIVEEASSPEKQLSTPTIQPTNTNSPNITTPESTSISTATIVPLDTPTSLPKSPDNMLFRLAYGQYFDVFKEADSQGLFEHEVIEYYSHEMNVSNLEPSNALIASFSHYSNKIAYWVNSSEGGKIFVYDLLSNEQLLIFSDDSGEFSIEQFGSQELSLIWSQDDLHLIIRNNQNLESSMIYNLTEDSLTSWEWKCDQIAISLRTNKLATWCISLGSEDMFAVMEWGGEIWISDSAPEHNIVQSDALQIIWSFSPDGEYVVFFDPTSNGNLSLANNLGLLTVLLPNAAWWENDDFIASKLSAPTFPIQWSVDGKSLLVFANELDDTHCPQWDNISAAVSTIYDIPCWQLINLETGAILWSLGESFQQEQSRYWQFDTATLSSNGNYVAVTAESPGFFATYIIDLVRNETLLWDSGASTLKWAN